MYTRLLLASVLGMALVTFSPAANARVPSPVSQAEQDFLQGDLLLIQGLVDLLLGRVQAGESLFLQGFTDIQEGYAILASAH